MKRACSTFLVLVLSAGLSLPLSADNSSTALQSAFNEHCIKCHGKGESIEGRINLLTLKSGDHVRPQLLEQLVTVLED
ncbi:MAG: hypothetical protein ABGZ35_13105, partial [Planctomycetaceae bacterium]